MRGFVRMLGSMNAARARSGSAASHSSRAMPSSAIDPGMPTVTSSSSTRVNSVSRRASSSRPPTPRIQAAWAYFSGAT